METNPSWKKGIKDYIESISNYFKKYEKRYNNEQTVIAHQVKGLLGCLRDECKKGNKNRSKKLRLVIDNKLIEIHILFYKQ